MSKKEVFKGERVAKVIARVLTQYSRRDVEKLISEGVVKVNGEVISSPAINITDQSIKIKNKLLPAPEKTKLYLFHKPSGCLVSKKSEDGKKTIYDFLPENMFGMIPVGRLDMNTEGLLLLTNNGDLSRYMSLPNTGWIRKYRARVYGKINVDRFKALAQRGVTIDGVRYGAIKIEVERERDFNSWLNISLTEGKNREIKKVLEHYGLKVNRLIRTTFGSLSLGSMKRNEVKEVSDKVLKSIIGDKVKI